MRSRTERCSDGVVRPEEALLSLRPRTERCSGGAVRAEGVRLSIGVKTERCSGEEVVAEGASWPPLLRRVVVESSEEAHSLHDRKP